MKIWKTQYSSNIHSTISIVVVISNKGLCHRKYKPKFKPREFARERSENYIIRNDPEEQVDQGESQQEQPDYTPKLKLTPFVNKDELDQYGINDVSPENEREINNFYVFRNQQNSEFTPPDEISEEEQALDTHMRVYKDNQSDLHKSPNFSSK